jgi:hypothetical protein
MKRERKRPMPMFARVCHRQESIFTSAAERCGPPLLPNHWGRVEMTDHSLAGTRARLRSVALGSSYTYVTAIRRG